MKVLVTGSSGLVGRALIPRLTGAGHFVVRLVRGEPDRIRGDVVWDPVTGYIERASLKGIDAVIHLAGENILGLWTQAKRERIHRSRVAATEYLAEALASLAPRPKVMLSASAIGYYGDQGDERLNERSPVGNGFLARLTYEWEEATTLARRAGIRVVNTRIGLVLTPQGGALGGMLPAFRLGLGGTLGLGRHYMSWITLHDLIEALLFLLETPSIQGPVNLTTPNPVTNRVFTKTLASTLHRPAFLPVPSPLLKLLPGRMAEQTLLCSARVEPEVLTRAGFVFEHADIESALADLVD
jgi:uncharacterized protein (TIGR01777 family)